MQKGFEWLKLPLWIRTKPSFKDFNYTFFSLTLARCYSLWLYVIKTTRVKVCDKNIEIWTTLRGLTLARWNSVWQFQIRHTFVLLWDSYIITRLLRFIIKWNWTYFCVPYISPLWQLQCSCRYIWNWVQF